MADILVRNIEAGHIAALDRRADELSTQTGRRISRNEVIRLLIQQECEGGYIQQRHDEYMRAVENLITTLDGQDRALRELIDAIPKMIRSLLGEEVEW